MSKKILSKKEIIEDTFKFYSEDVSRRSLSLSGRGCSYNSHDGKHCAFARFVSDENKPKLREGYYAENNMHLLSSEYQTYDSDFWNAIQYLHDAPEHWNKNGATEIGIEYKDKLLKKYSD